MSTADSEIIEKPVKKRKKNTGYDRKVANILAMSLKQVPANQISRVVGMSPGSVEEKIKKFSSVFKELKNVPNYRNGRADLLDAAELLALKNVVSKMDKGSLRECVYAFDKVFTAGRLTRGESTANHSHKHSFTSPQLKEIANETE